MSQTVRHTSLNTWRSKVSSRKDKQRPRTYAFLLLLLLLLFKGKKKNRSDLQFSSFPVTKQLSGTAKRTARSLEKEIENMGGHLNAYTSREQTTYWARTMKKDTGKALDVIADILQNPKLAAKWNRVAQIDGDSARTALKVASGEPPVATSMPAR